MSNSCDPMSSPPGSSIHGILQARILEWVAISFSTKWSLMASTSGGCKGAQERQRLLKFSTQGFVPRKFSTQSKFTVSNDQGHTWGPAGIPEGKEQSAHLPSLTEGQKTLAHTLPLRKWTLPSPKSYILTFPDCLFGVVSQSSWSCCLPAAPNKT